jgi:hypothetical protein
MFRKKFMSILTILTLMFLSCGITPTSAKPRNQQILQLSEVGIGDYLDLEAAINEIGDTVTTLVIDVITPVNSVIIVPNNITLKFIKPGALSISNTASVTIEGTIMIPYWSSSAPHQIFIIQGDGFTNLKSMYVRYPQWWGAQFDGVTNDSEAWNHAINSGDGGIIMHAGGTSFISSPIVITGSTSIKGVGRDISIIKNGGMNTNAIEGFHSTEGLLRDLVFENFKIISDISGGSNGDGIHIDGEYTGCAVDFENLLVKNHENGITLLGTIETRIRRCRMVDNDGIGFNIRRGSGPGTKGTTTMIEGTYSVSNYIGYYIQDISGLNLIATIEEHSTKQGYLLKNCTGVTLTGIYSEGAGLHAIELLGSICVNITCPILTQVGGAGVYLSSPGASKPLVINLYGGNISLMPGSGYYGFDDQTGALRGPACVTNVRGITVRDPGNWVSLFPQ